MYHKAFEVSIHCEGRPLPEFSTKVDNRTVSCFVASEVGKVFSIKWSSHINSFVSVNCFMDGHPMGCTTVKPRRSGSREGIRTSPTTHRLFRFAPLVVTDDAGLVDPRYGNIADLGIIEVRICRITRHSDKLAMKLPVIPPRGPVHEQSKKAGLHCVTLGTEVRCNAQTPSNKVTYIDKPDEPYVKFIFRYRPRGVCAIDTESWICFVDRFAYGRISKG
ncbi:hypothetical protein B0H21DRAFT_692882 [Amylocystis lapponica]|nr:hypothetical protein B0H21DRAFT_692882 [Amylocystis lapponica]